MDKLLEHLNCGECGENFKYFDDVIKIEGKFYCTECRVPITGIIAYHDPFEVGSWWDADDVETGDPGDFGFYEDEAHG